MNFVDGAYNVLKQMFQPESDSLANDDAPFASEPRDIDGGKLTCGAPQDVGNTDAFFTLDAMNAAADDFCQRHVDSPFKWGPSDDPEPSRSFKEIFT